MSTNWRPRGREKSEKDTQLTVPPGSDQSGATGPYRTDPFIPQLPSPFATTECSESDRLSLVASNLIHASLIVCESVLTEKTGLVSAIRIMDVLTVASIGLAHFFTLTKLHSTLPLDP